MAARRNPMTIEEGRRYGRLTAGVPRNYTPEHIAVLTARIGRARDAYYAHLRSVKAWREALRNGKEG